MAKNKNNNNSNETPEEKIIRLEQENEEYRGIIKDLMAQLESKGKSGDEKVTVENNGKKYLVTIPSFRHNGIVYNPKDLLENKEVVAELVEMGFGGLQEVLPETEEEEEETAE